MTDERTYPTRPFLAVSAAIVRDGKLLVVRRARQPGIGWHTFPGGGVELGETLEAAVEREVREETGLEVKAGPILEVFDRIVRDDAGRVEYHYVLVDFVCRVVGGELRAGSDASGVALVDFADLEACGVSQKAREVIARGAAAAGRI